MAVKYVPHPKSMLEYEKCVVAFQHDLNSAILKKFFIKRQESAQFLLLLRSKRWTRRCRWRVCPFGPLPFQEHHARNAAIVFPIKNRLQLELQAVVGIFRSTGHVAEK